MTVNFPLPRLSDGPPSKNIQELKSYLYQLVEQLNYTINSLESLQTAEASATSESPSGGGGSRIPTAAEVTYDNSVSGLASVNVQDAIDAVKTVADSKAVMTVGTADMSEGDPLTAGTFYAVYEAP